MRVSGLVAVLTRNIFRKLIPRANVDEAWQRFDKLNSISYVINLLHCVQTHRSLEETVQKNNDISSIFMAYEKWKKKKKKALLGLLCSFI